MLSLSSGCACGEETHRSGLESRGASPGLSDFPSGAPPALLSAGLMEGCPRCPGPCILGGAWGPLVHIFQKAPLKLQTTWLRALGHFLSPCNFQYKTGPKLHPHVMHTEHKNLRTVCERTGACIICRLGGKEFQGGDKEEYF